MNKLPLFSYKTSIVCIDDDALFLQSISNFISLNYNVRTFQSPEIGLNFFSDYEPLLPSLNYVKGCVEDDNYETLNHMPVDLNIDALKTLRNNVERYNEIAVLIIDYNMPNMNGVEFCRKCAHLPMKKILLTGEADSSMAIAAFNEGLIDFYMRKDSLNIANELLYQVKRLSQNYLCAQTESLRSYLEIENKLPLSDFTFSEFVYAIQDNKNFIEHYLIDKLGNLVFFDQEGKSSFLVVHTERTLNNFVDLHHKDKGVEKHVADVKNRLKIPFFGEGMEGWQVCPEEWAQYFFPAKLLVGKENYYWSLISK